MFGGYGEQYSGCSIMFIKLRVSNNFLGVMLEDADGYRFLRSCLYLVEEYIFQNVAANPFKSVGDIVILCLIIIWQY